MDPLGITLFCDDIRFEQYGKITLVGCYGPEMLIGGNLPTVIPRFAMYVQLRLPAGSALPSKILVYFPESKDEDPAMTVDIASPNAENIEKSRQNMGSDTVSLLATNVPILLGPTIITAEGLIKVRVKWGEQTIKAGTLRVRCVDDLDPMSSISK